MGLLAALATAAPLCAAGLLVLLTAGVIVLAVAARFAVRYDDVDSADAVADSLAYWAADDRP